MYRERRKLHPAQPKNQAEFHSILDDIGVVANRDDDFVHNEMKTFSCNRLLISMVTSRRPVECNDRS
jgi:hypothetical protein